MGFGKLIYFLIIIIDMLKLVYGEELVGVKILLELFCIVLKDKSCGLNYGRNYYDFDEGVMMFIVFN